MASILETAMLNIQKLHLQPWDRHLNHLNDSTAMMFRWLPAGHQTWQLKVIMDFPLPGLSGG